ncbi:saccharopine dehydrogenase family protein [Aminobacter sp. AP02]|uniref:saccharopine dehydrogenase family protein n=1 Tax=Aminobacter sp. AP02 TaxID=2135737 RepID=UPI00247A1686|nr:saccharopine dehydrogenase family protein [Aminobacter sp. AP02]
MRLCTVVLDTPSLRASSAVEARAFSRRRLSSARSGSVVISSILFVVLPNTYRLFGETDTAFRRDADIESARNPFEGDMTMKQIVVVGAGKIGSTIADMLAETGDYNVTVVDRSQAALDSLETGNAVQTLKVEIAEAGALDPVLACKFAVLSAAPFHLTTRIAQAAAKAGVHYLDLTEDVASTRIVKELAATAKSAFIPQCGLAPGFISIVANDLAKRFDSLESVRMRVGALPQYPSNALNYNLTWSTDGVINEYCEPCEAIVEGSLVEVPPLEEREEFSLDGITYEAFNTSGGLGTLCETYKGKVRTLNYRTIRYPGHAAIMKALLNDLGLRHRREVLKDILENALPATMQDVVVIFVTVSGRKNGRLLQESYANKIYSRQMGKMTRSAIQITTASGICSVLDMLASGALPQQGFIRQEDIALDAFLANRFGHNYAQAATSHLAA